MPPGPWRLFQRLPRKSGPALLSPRLWAYSVFQVAKVWLVAHIFTIYIGGIGSTTGISMMPSIPQSNSKETVWIMYSNIHRRGRKIKVGDVIMYKNPIFPTQRGCKRVIGMPGDFVSVITPGRTNDDFHAVDVEGKWASVREQVIRVPEGHCWVAGDNLEWSRDSRHFGPLPLGLVKSKVLAVVRPWREAKWLGKDGELNDFQDEKREPYIT